MGEMIIFMNFSKLFLFVCIVIALMSVGFAGDVGDMVCDESLNEAMDFNQDTCNVDDYKLAENDDKADNINEVDASGKLVKDSDKSVKSDDEVSDEAEEVNITSSNFKSYFTTMGKEVYMGNKITQTNNSLLLNIQYLPSNIWTVNIDENSNRFANLSLTLNFSTALKLNNTGLYLASNFRNITVENFNSTFDNSYTGNDFLTVDSNVNECFLRNIWIDMNMDGVASGNVVDICAKTTLADSYIRARLVETNIDWESGPRITDAIGVSIISGGCLLENNTIEILSSGNNGGQYYSLYALCVRASNTCIISNNISLTDCMGYAYAIVARSNNNVIKNNNITVVSHTYSNGVNFEMSMFKNNMVCDNYVNVTAGYGSAPWGNPCVAYALQMLDFNYAGGAFDGGGDHPDNNSFVNNTLVGSAGQIYGIEIFGTCNTYLSANTINLTSRTPMGIGVIGSNITISDNVIVNNGTHNRSEGTADYLEAINVGIYAYKSFKGTVKITNNTVTAYNGRAIQVKESGNVMVMDNTVNVTDYDYAVELINRASDNLVENNTLYSRNRKGDKAVTGKVNNTVRNNHPEPDPLLETEITLQTESTVINCSQRCLISGILKQKESTNGIRTSAISVYDNGVLLRNISTLDDGSFSYSYTTDVAGMHNVTFSFIDDDIYAPAESCIMFTAKELVNTYKLVVDTTEFSVGANNIVATIYYGNDYTQEVAANISKGKVTFKVNGKALKDASGKTIYAKVVNGTAVIENYQVPASWENRTSLQAVYSGSTLLSKLESSKTSITLTSSVPTITTENIQASTGSVITLTATLNTNAVVNSGKVVFKINGKTVKDSKGKVIYARVVNNQVSFEYTLPDSMKAGTYNVTAVYTGSEYGRLEDVKTLTIA